MKVYTSRSDYKGKDKIDIGPRSLSREGLLFVPSPKLLATLPDPRQGTKLSPEAWAQFVSAYTEEMEASQNKWMEAWDRIFEWSQVTFTCDCPSPEQCHRTVLAKEIFPSMGATFAGEWRDSLFW